MRLKRIITLGKNILNLYKEKKTFEYIEENEKRERNVLEKEEEKKKEEEEEDEEKEEEEEDGEEERVEERVVCECGV